MVTEIEHVSLDCTCTGKTCTKCEKLLCIENFNFRLSYRKWRVSDCKICAYKRVKIWQQNNKEKVYLNQRIYKENNLDKLCIDRQKHNALKQHANGVFTLQQWEELKHFYNYTCLCCKKKEPEIKLEIDHIVPLYLGGSNDISNIQPLCRSCNASKQISIIDYRTT